MTPEPHTNHVEPTTALDPCLQAYMRLPDWLLISYPCDKAELCPSPSVILQELI